MTERRGTEPSRPGTPKRTKRCESISPLSGLRCGLRNGHKEGHRPDAYELKAYIDEITADTFVVKRTR